MQPGPVLTFTIALLAGCAPVELMREQVREEPWRMYQTPFQRFTNIYNDNLAAGHRQLYLKDYHVAIASYQQAHDAAERLKRDNEKGGHRPGEPWVQMSTALRGMGNAYDGLGDLPRAEPLYRQALELREGVWGPDNLPAANVLADLGNNLRRQGRYAEALAAFDRVVKIFEPRDLPHDFALVLADIGKVYAAQGSLAEAEAFARRALVTTEQAMLRPHRYPEALANQRVLHVKEYAASLRRSARTGEAERLDARLEELVRQQREQIAALRERGGRDDYADHLEKHLREVLSD